MERKGLIVLFILVVGLMYIYVDGMYYEVSSSSKVEEAELAAIEYNTTEIDLEVIELTEEYFVFKDRYNLKIENLEMSVWYSYWETRNVNLVGKEEIIGIGVSDIKADKEMYKLVITHEYTHHVLFVLGISSEDDNTNEALADTFTWWVNKEKCKGVWGKKNQRRNYPYNIVITPILESYNFDCLDKVFIKEDKIDSLDDYKNRLRTYCNSTI